MNLTAHATLFTLAAIGLSEVVYLIRSRKASIQPVCPLTGECHVVLESKYNRIFGVHNDTLGLLFYAMMIALTGLIVVGIEPLIWWKTLVAISVVGSMIFSLVLLFLQWRVIKAWCFWCVISSMTVFAMALIISFGF